MLFAVIDKLVKSHLRLLRVAKLSKRKSLIVNHLRWLVVVIHHSDRLT